MIHNFRGKFWRTIAMIKDRSDITLEWKLTIIYHIWFPIPLDKRKT